MPLTNGKYPAFDFDGDYIQFRMEDGDKIVLCAVMLDYLNHQAIVDGKDEQSPRELFKLYRPVIERIASAKFDAGSDRPIVTGFDVDRK